MLAAKGTSHTSSLEQPPPQKKQTSIVGLATRNATIAVASPEPLSSIEQHPPPKKQSSSAGLKTRNTTIAVASPEPLSSIEQPPPQTKQASIAEESISSRFQVASFYGAAQSAKNPPIEQPPLQNKQASKQRLEHTWAETWR